MQLTSDMVLMGQAAQHKDKALEIVANALAAQGLVADFADALKAREKIANTYLGQAIAIPHGTPDYKDKVTKTGVALVHFAEGVDWGNGNVVHLAVGIAANSDEHLDILKMLARLIDNEGLANQLKTAKTADEVLLALEQTQTNHQAPMPQALTPYFLETHATDMESLLTLASHFLNQKQAVSSGFLTSILTKPVICLAKGVGLLHSGTAVIQPTALAVSLSEPLYYKNTPLTQLLLLATHGTNKEYDAIIDKILQNPPAGRDDWRCLFGQDEFVCANTVLANHHGLHARPATALSEVAAGFKEEMQISLDNDNFVSAKSLVRLLSLGAECGATLYLRTPKTGNADERLTAVVSAIQAGLGEEISPIDPVAVIAEKGETQEVLPLVANQPYHGMIASGGLCIAPAHVVREYEFDFEKFSNNQAEQKQRLAVAITEVKADLDKIIQNAKTREIAEIFKAHQGILGDDEILAGVHKRIDEGLSAPMAWHSELGQLANAQARLDNPVLAERAADLKDIGQRVLASMCGISVPLPQGKYVLIKDDLLPSDVAALGDEVSAIVTAFGGVNSHSAIIARSLGIPALVGVGVGVLGAVQGETVLVNAEEGFFVLNPDEMLVKTTEEALAKLKYKQNIAKINTHEPAKTTDGHRLEVAVNLGDVANVKRAVELGAEGVGLLRTEFVFMKHTAMPSIAKQKADYKEVFDAMQERPVVVRTLDVGGDKPLPYLAMNKEDNPFLGVRGVRLTLRKPDIFKDQLTALIAASNEFSEQTGISQPLRLMFPMIGQLDEWHKAKAILDEVLADNPHNNLQVGMMIEVPSAAILAAQFAKEVDFFSIGTNDLTQYTLAIDRGHPVLSAQADGLDPSVLKLIETTVKAAHAHGKWVGVCGELAADADAIPVFVGLGVDELSVSASQIPLVKMHIRELSFVNCQQLANQALSATSGEQVRQLVKEMKAGNDS